MSRELERNVPGHPDWEGSFYERLSEYAEWNIEKFWDLHFDLLSIANSRSKNTTNSDFCYALLYLQQRVLNLIIAHYNPEDIFNIHNINNQELFEFKERFEMAIIGAITGEVLSESCFDLMNLLIKTSRDA